jgi:hypothetical protein
MYSDNSQNKGMNNPNSYNSNIPFNPYNNNIQNFNIPKPNTNTVNPLGLQFSNMNLNSSSTFAPNGWNNNTNVNNYNTSGNNMNTYQMNNIPSGYNNLNNQNSVNKNTYGPTTQFNNNNQGYNLYGNNLSYNTTNNSQTKFNDVNFILIYCIFTRMTLKKFKRNRIN